MKIALDYDDTITRDPEMWKAFVTFAQSRGHEIRIVTFRSKTMDNSDLYNKLNLYGIDLPIIFTAFERKRVHCASIDFYPDVWIDDCPELICRDDTYIPGEMLARQVAIANANVPCVCNRPDCIICIQQWEGRN